MKTIRLRSLLVMVMPILLNTSVYADDWAAPKPQVVRSAQGHYELHTFPNGYAGPTQMKLYVLKPSPSLLYQQKMADHSAPVVILVANNGQVATLGEWDNFGYGHALVIYAPDGKIVTSHHLEEILTPQELFIKTDWSVSSRWWIKNDSGRIIDDQWFQITTAWGEVIHFKLSDGSQWRKGKPFPIPSDRTRFIDGTGPMKFFSSMQIDLHVSGQISAQLNQSKSRGLLHCTIDPNFHQCTLYTKKRKKHQWSGKHNQDTFHKYRKQASHFADHLSEERKNSLPSDHILIRFRFSPKEIRYPKGPGWYEYKVLASQDALLRSKELQEVIQGWLDLIQYEKNKGK